MDVERGVMGKLPYFSVGSGPPLAFLGGLASDTGVEADSTVRMNGSLLKPFTASRTVHFFNRRPGLPRGMTMAEMATEHAEALREGFGGEPVDMFGISTGGSIAQQVAADHPDVVRRLVLISSACRLGPLGRSMQAELAGGLRARRRPCAWAGGAGGPPPWGGPGARRRGRLARPGGV